MKKMQLFLKVVAALVLVVAGIIISFGQKAYAASPAQSITIAPTSIDQSVQPGSVTNGSFQVINSGSANFTFSVYATPFRVTNEAYNPAFTPIPGAPNAVSWIHFSNNGTEIAARQTISVDYSIKVPAGTPAGGYYIVAFAQTKTLPSTTTGVVVTERVGEIFYLRVAGNAKQAGQLLTWQANFLQKPPLTGTVRIEDNGAYNFPAKVNINVKNIFGHQVYAFETTRQILPQTIRRITVPWKTSPSLGLFKIGGSASFLNQTHQLPSKYVLVMSQPIRLVLLVIIIVLLIMGIYRWFSRRQAGNKKYRRY